MVSINKNYLYLAGFLILGGLLLLQKCQGDKSLADLSTQFARYADSSITHRQVDGKDAVDTKGAELSKDEYKAANAAQFAFFQRLAGKQADLIATLTIALAHRPIIGNAPVTINKNDKSMTIDLTDSCSLIGNVQVDSNGIATKNIQQRTDSLNIAISRSREKFWQGKQVVATGMVMNNCGNIVAQKAVVVTEGKKKVQQTNIFKAGIVIAIFEGIRFLLTGKL